MTQGTRPKNFLFMIAPTNFLCSLLIFICSSNGFSQSSQDSSSQPKWNPKDTSKGFQGVDEDGNYLYAPTSDEDNIRDHGTEMRKLPPRPENIKNGLMGISSDGSYLYRIKESDTRHAGSLHFGIIPPPHLTSKYDFTFVDMYTSSNLTAMTFDYEWIMSLHGGIWGISAGTGFATTKGSGRFANDGTEAIESYTFYLIPNHVSGYYRMQYSKHPWVVPCFSAGIAPVLAIESRDDGKMSKAISPSIIASGSVKFNLNRLDSESTSQLDADYGITNIWLDLEAKVMFGLNPKMNLSSQIYSVGFSFDF